ncbi:unnamed protein product [Periconia digitata]|uniref:S-adenosyl-L-methionine-dependent methyltransferase n=1 Tax=Periconia digitata TaxID=1303443 RepID=A0A9W4UMK7_9PLEO|nr:unnamed protein product [Periconia digitata]
MLCDPHLLRLFSNLTADLDSLHSSLTPRTASKAAERSSPCSLVSIFIALTTICSSTKSVDQSIFNFVRENGRTYHRYQAGSYPFPNDQFEIERMDLQYEILKVLFKGRSFFAPLKDPRKILDIGTGTGKWAIEMDLSPIQPEWVPNNVKFVIDDANEEDWMLDPMDFIHTRLLIGCFEDFREVIKSSYRHLKPGAWMESQEIMPTVYCDDGTMAGSWPYAEWVQTQDQAAMNLGKPLRIANKLKRWYEQAGFVDVHEEVFKLPLNSWPKDPQFKMLGRFNETCYLDGLQAWSLQLFTRGLEWTKDEIEVYLVQVRKALSDRSVHAYNKIYVVYGRKPRTGEVVVPKEPTRPPPAPPTSEEIIDPEPPPVIEPPTPPPTDAS